jgi:hypothetical protein
LVNFSRIFFFWLLGITQDMQKSVVCFSGISSTE